MNVRSVVLRARKVRLFIREKFNIPKGQTKNIKISGEFIKINFCGTYFPALSSYERFMRCMGASERFSAPLSRARGPQSTRARGGDREVMTCHALVQSWFYV